MISERMQDVFDMASALFIAYWAVSLSQYIWDIFVIVVKTLVTEALLP